MHDGIAAAAVPLAVRGGVPSFARRVLSGQPAKIVAYGTSLTKAGYYLAPLVPHLAAVTGNDAISLQRHGLSSASSVGAVYRFGVRVLPLVPDLVVLEFAVNDDYWNEADECAAGLIGMLYQLRARYPRCDVVFVYLAAAGKAAAGKTPAAMAHEGVAERYAIPSLDLSCTAERLVSSGDCTWVGDGDTALTSDGTHHLPRAAQLLGEPLAREFARLVRLSAELPPQTVSIAKNAFASARALNVRQLLEAGSWGVAQPPESEFSGYIFDEFVSIAQPDAQMRLRFSGSSATLWTLLSPGEVALRIGVDGVERIDTFVGGADTGQAFAPVPLVQSSGPDGVYEIRVTNASSAPVAFGDVFILGVPLP